MGDGVVEKWSSGALRNKTPSLHPAVPDGLSNPRIMQLVIFSILASIATANAADGLLLDLIVPPRDGDRFQHAEYSCSQTPRSR
jgi:hypothetical protein